LEWGIRHGGFDALRSEREGARMGRGSKGMRLLCLRRRRLSSVQEGEMQEFLGRGGGLVVIGASHGGAGVDRYWHLGNFGGRR
jgi:hypothetical protein